MRQQPPPPNPQPLRTLAFSGRRSASGGLFLKAPSSQPVFPFPALAFQRRLLRAVLGLRPRRCSRVASLQASARSCLQTHNTLALRHQGYGLTGGNDTDAPLYPESPCG